MANHPRSKFRCNCRCLVGGRVVYDNQLSRRGGHLGIDTQYRSLDHFFPVIRGDENGEVKRPCVAIGWRVHGGRIRASAASLSYAGPSVRPPRHFNKLLTLGSAASAAAAGYSLVLLAAAARRATTPSLPACSLSEPRLRLAALVPAHNEEETIERSVRSLSDVDYPGDAWQVCVVADNCTDRTAEAARTVGAQVRERDDENRLGKGHALDFGLQALMASENPPDAVIVLDADCEASPNLPRVVERELRGGARAVQVSNTVSNPCASVYSALRYAAFSAINSTRPRGRTQLGFSAGLLGTGMGFSRELLTKHPWTAYGLAEDSEYHLSLVVDGERVAFAGDAAVSSPMPTSFESAGTQQARWEEGRWRLVRRWLPRLARAGIRRRDPACAAAAFELVVPPLSLHVAGTGGLFMLSALTLARGATKLSLFALSGQAVYVIGSLVIAQAPACAYRALLAAPLLMAWQLRIVVRTITGAGPRSWVRTRREPEGTGVGRPNPYTAVDRNEMTR